MNQGYLKSQRAAGMSGCSVLITGAGGMLGTALMEILPQDFDCTGFSSKPKPPVPNRGHWAQGNLLDFSRLTETIRHLRPNVIVHAASSVSVNECEKPENRDSIQKLHVGLTEVLVDVARELGAQIIYISTESVYDGTKSGLYIEGDQTNPRNNYARTKLAGETPVLNYERGLVLRSNIIGWRTDGILSFGEWVVDGILRNEKRTMLTDVVFTPVSSYCLAETIGDCMKMGLTGLYHAGGADVVSKYELGLKIARSLELSTEVLVPVTLDQIAMGAPRPRNTSLDSSRLAVSLKKPRPTIDEAVRRWAAHRPEGLKS